METHIISHAGGQLTADGLIQKIMDQHGFLTQPDLVMLARLDRLRPVLIRCGCCRFTCPAQNAARLIGYVEADKQDHVRDVSLTVADRPAE